MRRSHRPAWALLAVGLLAACAAAPEAEPESGRAVPSTARLDMVEMLRRDDVAERSPGDGGGRVRLVDGTAAATAGQPGSWHFEFETGPHGIAPGGFLLFQVSPFWDWSTPQVRDRERPGFTTVSSDAGDATLEPETLGDGLLGIRVAGAALAPTTRVRIGYGVGPAGARADRFAEGESPFWFAVDADGDGVRALLAECPTIAVRAGAPAMLLAHLPSVARPGETVRLVVAALDARGSAGPATSGPLTIVDPPPQLGIDALPPLDAATGARVVANVTVTEPGLYRLTVRGPGGLEAVTNPLEVRETGPRILWADLHGHSALSDGTGTPTDYFTYARDVAALDVVALTDHDHWGMRALDRHPDLWRAIQDATATFHDPGRFVTLPGYEWTSWIHGHRHVLYFDDQPAALHGSLDPPTDHPTGLWDALAGRDAITIAHHSAGGPIATNWDVAPDPRFEPVTEVVSVHGSSEAEDSPARIYSAIRGHFVRDALDRGYRLGFVGSGDSHDGHPGLAHVGNATGGLAAIVAEERTRAAVLEALRSRRVYATSGARIVLRFAIDETPMGGTLPAGAANAHRVFVDVVGTAPLERVDLIRSGAVVASDRDLDASTVTLTSEMDALGAGEYVYVRVVQRDGALAWSSPIFAD